jgi:hypothetical protein
MPTRPRAALFRHALSFSQVFQGKLALPDEKTFRRPAYFQFSNNA